MPTRTHHRPAQVNASSHPCNTTPGPGCVRPRAALLRRPANLACETAHEPGMCACSCVVLPVFLAPGWLRRGRGSPVLRRPDVAEAHGDPPPDRPGERYRKSGLTFQPLEGLASSREGIGSG